MNDFGMGVGMWVFCIAIIVFVVLVIKVMMNGNTSQGDKIIDSSTNDSPMDILKKRYASGEINQDEFENMKKELEK